MVSNNCPNCGAPLPHMEQDLKYNCSYCGSAVAPSSLPIVFQNALDKITGAKAVMAKPVYAPGRYAAVASVKALMALVSAFTLGAFFPPLGVIMLVSSFVFIAQVAYWLVKSLQKLAAQRKLPLLQVEEDKQAIAAYYAAQQKAGRVALKWLACLTVCCIVIFSSIMLDGIISADVLGITFFATIIISMLFVALLWMNALAWIKDPNEENEETIY